MGGNAGIRGYIIQTIICVLDVLKSDNNWLTVTLEPLDESEKVDIRWKYPDDKVKLSQVKSSKNKLTHSMAKKWCSELKSKSPDATDYELQLLGPIADNLKNINEIDGVNVKKINSIDISILLDQASTKIDFYYSSKNKPKISPQVRETIIHSLNSRFVTSSIIGEEIKRVDFDNNLLKWISDIEKQIEINPFASLAPPIDNNYIPINHRISKKILDLVGWKHFSENYFITEFNEHTLEDDEYKVNFYGDVASNLKEQTGDFIMISSKHDHLYPNSSKLEVKNSGITEFSTNSN